MSLGVDKISGMGVKHTKVKMEMTEIRDTFPIDCLPVEILQLIFSYVPSRDLVVNCSRVCRQWQQLVNDEVFWLRQCDSAGVVYPANTIGCDAEGLLNYQRLYFFRPFCRNLVKNWNAAG